MKEKNLKKKKYERKCQSTKRIILNEIEHFHDDITKILASSFLRHFLALEKSYLKTWWEV